MFYKVYTGPSCFPETESIPGSYTSVGDVITVYNASDLQVGDYLYNVAQNQVRKVLAFITNNTLSIESAFTSDVTVAVNILIANRDEVYTKATIYNAGGAIGYLNGEEVAVNQTVPLEDSRLCFTINGTGTKIAVTAAP